MVHVGVPPIVARIATKSVVPFCSRPETTKAFATRSCRVEGECAGVGGRANE